MDRDKTAQREDAIASIQSEYKRLRMTPEQVEISLTAQGISFERSPLWNLTMYLDLLKNTNK